MSIFKSVTSLFTHIHSLVENREGKAPGEKRWTAGRWGGYTLTEKDRPNFFSMENEDTGERVTVEVTDDWGRPNQYRVEVCKCYIISSDDEGGWHSHFMRNLPSSEEQVDTLAYHLAELHGTGLHTIHKNWKYSEEKALKEKVAELEKTVARQNERLGELGRQLDNIGWY